MLKIYIDDELSTITEEIISDVEREFRCIEIMGTDIERKVIQIIDKGDYIDSNSFFDRFGNKTDIDHLSTGCKGILTILNRPNIAVDTIEFGKNALDTLISFCTTGIAILPDTAICGDYRSLNGTNEIDVNLDGIRFNNVEKLNYYINNLRGLQ